MKGIRATLWVLLAFLMFPVAGFCGGAWVMDPGKVDIYLGFSRKTANTSWNANGDFLRHETTTPPPQRAANRRATRPPD